MIERDAEEHARRSTEELERRLAVMKKAARLDIAARLYAAWLASDRCRATVEACREARAVALQDAAALIEENEARS